MVRTELQVGDRCDISGRVLAMRPLAGTVVRDLGLQWRNGWRGRFYEVRADDGRIVWSHTAKPLGEGVGG